METTDKQMGQLDVTHASSAPWRHPVDTFLPVVSRPPVQPPQPVRLRKNHKTPARTTILSVILTFTQQEPSTQTTENKDTNGSIRTREA